ncbi:hypothetical protein PF001_g32246 [Phytophthora fragariae]|uniref:Uncharacterized protein n=1 Tax=Phytophthora fragariae TaxID=53985 RepID=A0A6A3PK14_9STRA|nr:hypothetical protein PF006_g32306 [Phytophthora fragariae]KAE9261882.1 hypothetical protein PF001_g32246 [Phytophthora fragariae]
MLLVGGRFGTSGSGVVGALLTAVVSSFCSSVRHEFEEGVTSHSDTSHASASAARS